MIPSQLREPKLPRDPKCNAKVRMMGREGSSPGVSGGSVSCFNGNVTIGGSLVKKEGF